MNQSLTIRFLAVFSLFFALFISGCLSSGYAQKCASVVGSVEKDQCIEYMAVWYQDPYTCYEIKDSLVKESCLERSLDEKEARMLQAQREYEKQSIEVVVEDKKIAQAIVEEQASGISPQVKQCMEEMGLSIDGCMHKVAIENMDIEMCEKIGSENYRRPCISNIAITSKDATICDKLVRADDKQLCRFYAVSD